MKEKLLKKIIIAKNIYDDKLLDKKFLYIYECSITNREKYLELQFDKRNFLHLIGVETKLSASFFYKKLNSNKMRLEDINVDKNGWAIVKLNIFHKLPTLFSSPVQISTHNNLLTVNFTSDLLINKPGHNQIDPIILGIKENEKSGFYVPASLLKRNPVEVTSNPSTVLAIFSKNKKDEKYEILEYKKKDYSIEKVKDIRVKNIIRNDI